MNQDSKQSEQEQTIEDLKAWYETLPRPGSGQIVEVRLDEIADWHLTHLEAAKRDSYQQGRIDEAKTCEQAKRHDYIRVVEAAKRETAKAYGSCTNCYGKGWSSYTTAHSSHDTDQDIGSPGGRYYKKVNEPVFCKCDRGKQLEQMVEAAKREAREGYVQDKVEKESEV